MPNVHVKFLLKIAVILARFCLERYVLDKKTALNFSVTSRYLIITIAIYNKMYYTVHYQIKKQNC